MAVIIQLRRGSAVEWTTADPLLAEGELGWEMDTGRFKVGNGIDTWSALPYFTGSEGLAGFMPTYIGPGEIVTIPANKQGLYALPIINDGSFVITGDLVMVD